MRSRPHDWSLGCCCLSVALETSGLGTVRTLANIFCMLSTCSNSLQGTLLLLRYNHLGLSASASEFPAVLKGEFGLWKLGG